MKREYGNGTMLSCSLTSRKTINVGAGHLCYAKPGFLPNKTSSASEGEITLSGNAFFNHSGAINSNLFNIAFSENTKDGTPSIIREDITTLASTTSFSGITYPLLSESSLLYLLASDLLTSLDSFSACSSVIFDLETIFLNFATLKNSSFNNLFISIDNSGLGIALNSDSSFFGTLTTNSSILISPKDNNENIYLKPFILGRHCPEETDSLYASKYNLEFLTLFATYLISIPLADRNLKFLNPLFTRLTICHNKIASQYYLNLLNRLSETDLKSHMAGTSNVGIGRDRKLDALLVDADGNVKVGI